MRLLVCHLFLWESNEDVWPTAGIKFCFHK